MPRDPTLKQFDTHYNVASYKRICNEFRINSWSDSRFTHEKKTTTGAAYTLMHGGATKMEFDYPGYDKFSDEGGRQSKGA